MSAPQGRRVLVAVAPVVLEGAFAAILELIALDEVVQFHAATAAQRKARYDAAIVTAEFDAEIVAGVVITLPDTHDDGGNRDHRRRGRVESGDFCDDVDIRDQREVIDLLDRHVPLAVCRSDRLAAVTRPT